MNTAKVNIRGYGHSICLAVAIVWAVSAPSIAYAAAPSQTAPLAQTQMQGNDGGSPDAARSSPAPGAEADATAKSPPEGKAARVQAFPGTGHFVKRRQRARADASGDVTLDFVDADVRDVVRAVMGDMLHIAYTVDPNVHGHMTLKTGAPVGKPDLLPALEAALEISGFALVSDTGGYDIIPMTSVQKRGLGISVLGDRKAEPGYGVEVVPLRFISAEEMQRVLSPLSPQGAKIRADNVRNLLFMTGTEPERKAMLDTIALFDVNYFRSMSFAIVQPQHVDAGTLAGELEKIFDSTDSPISGMVRLIPIARINSLLIATPRKSFLQELNKWIGRLDVPSTGEGRRLYFLHLRNSRAQDVAGTLAQLFGGAGGGAQVPNRTSASPGAGPAMSQVAGQMSLSANVPPIPSIGGVGAAPPRPGSAGAAANGPQIVTDEANNALIIRADQVEYEAILRIVKRMDIAPEQVLIEATIAEVTLNDQLKFGVEWAFKNAGSQDYTLSSDGSVKASFPGFAFSYVVPNVQAALSALSSKTKVNVLSSPRLLTLDNHAASLQVGDQVPVVTQTAVNVTAPGAPVVSSVDMRNTGVILSVTPRISMGGMVYMDVSQEVSDVVPTTTSGIDSPTIQQRRLQTTVAVQDGQTIALGGLIRQSSTEGRSGVPILSDIPLLGDLVSSKSNSGTRTELLIFLTPRVLHDAENAREMTESLASQLGSLKDMVQGLRPGTAPTAVRRLLTKSIPKPKSMRAVAH